MTAFYGLWMSTCPVLVLKGGPDDTCVGGGVVIFLSLCKLLFFAPNQKQTFFPSQAKEQANFFPYVTLFFCQYCEQTV